MDLNDIHKAQLSRFTTFFRSKRERVIVDVGSKKDDFVSDRLVDEGAIFNFSDVKALLDAYHAQVMGCLAEELEKNTSLSAVFVSQLLGQAQAAGMSLQVEDISVIEDQGRLGQIGALPAMSAPPLAPKAKATLSAVEGSGMADPAMLQQMQDLKAENKMMTERYMQLQTEVSTVLRERSMLTAELEQAKSNLASGGGGDPKAADYARQLGEKNAELEALRRDMGQRLSESTQFRELKSIVKKKTAENKDLKHLMQSAGVALPDSGQGIELEADSD